MSDPPITPTVGAATLTGSAAGNWPSSAFLNVTEFETLLEDLSSGSPFPRCPPITVQDIPFGAWPAVSAAFSQTTRIIRLQSTGVCAVAVGGPDPVATALCSMRMIADQPEYFAVVPGDWLSVVVLT